MTIPTNSPQSAWIAFFVRAVSPGQVLRLLERIARIKPEFPVSWLLSGPTQPQGYRVLLAQPPHVQSAGTTATLLNQALQAPVYTLQVSVEEWIGAAITQSDQATHTQGRRTAVGRGLLRFLKVKPHTEPWDAWARTYGLPVELLTDAGGIKQGQKVPYRTVAKLDQRSLLVERINTWYELTLDEV